MFGTRSGLSITGRNSRHADSANREARLVLTGTLAIGEDENNATVTAKSTSAVFGFDITGLDPSVGAGIILKCGGSSLGSTVHVDASGNLVARQRIGRSILADVPHVSGACPTGDGTLVVEFNVTTGQPRLWWNGGAFGVNGTVTQAGTWTGSGSTAYFNVVGSVPNGAPTAAFTGYETASTLRYYARQVAL